jgi:hypothetical protein
MKFFTDIDAIVYLDNIVTNFRYESERYTDRYYVDEQTFRRRLGLGLTKFYEMKKRGEFELAMRSDTRGSKRVKYHILFNYKTQRIELEGQKRLPIEQPKHRRNRNGKKAANQQSPQQKSEQGLQEGSSGNANQ